MIVCVYAKALKHTKAAKPKSQRIKGCADSIVVSQEGTNQESSSCGARSAWRYQGGQGKSGNIICRATN